jgi:hypothetical protein
MANYEKSDLLKLLLARQAEQIDARRAQWAKDVEATIAKAKEVAENIKAFVKKPCAETAAATQKMNFYGVNPGLFTPPSPSHVEAIKWVEEYPSDRISLGINQYTRLLNGEVPC